MGALRLDRVLEFLTSLELIVGLLWLGLAVFTITVLFLMQTRWGQSRALGKCVLLSLLAHLLLIGYSTTVRFVFAEPEFAEPVLRVSFVDEPAERSSRPERPPPEDQPWEEFVHDSVSQPEMADPQRREPEPPPEPRRETASDPGNLPGRPPLDHLALTEVSQEEPQVPRSSMAERRSSPGKSVAETIDAPPPQRREPARAEMPQAPTPGRRPATDDQKLTAAARRPRTGVPTALVKPLAPLPQVAAVPTTPEPVNSLASLTDRFTRPGRSRPAESTGIEAEQTGSGGDLAYAADGRNPAGTPRPEWTASRGPIDSRQPPGVVESGLPTGDLTVVVPPRLPRDRKGSPTGGMPSMYRLRVAPDRTELAEQMGATSATEAAVKAALKWLADSQKADGRWDANEHGAGRELMVAGRDRQGAGIQADTGMTGLALLAFLASGHTHRDGTYRDTVRRGLEYLLRMQGRDGNIAGAATPYARMYCHAMATFALSEAYGMTGDERLREPVGRAVDYTLAAQDQSAGGWRYQPGDPGDTSQCGWQLMALKSAELAGIPIPVKTRNGMIRYLRSASSGRYGGLSSYRPGERATRPMTAEALVCWQFLGMPREHPAANEAGDYLLEGLPGDGERNLYYWYYGTLGMYQLQGVYWRRWNDALQRTLIQSQRKAGPLVGSWDPNTVWGSYGGRVYSTALATLSLEVYYRFLPLYVEAGAR